MIRKYVSFEGGSSKWIEYENNTDSEKMYLTPQKLYLVKEDYGYSFHIDSDIGTDLLCLWKGCAQIKFEDWRLHEISEYVTPYFNETYPYITYGKVYPIIEFDESGYFYIVDDEHDRIDVNYRFDHSLDGFSWQPCDADGNPVVSHPLYINPDSLALLVSTPTKNQEDIRFHKEIVKAGEQYIVRVDYTDEQFWFLNEKNSWVKSSFKVEYMLKGRDWIVDLARGGPSATGRQPSVNLEPPFQSPHDSPMLQDQNLEVTNLVRCPDNAQLNESSLISLTPGKIYEVMSEFVHDDKKYFNIMADDGITFTGTYFNDAYIKASWIRMTRPKNTD